MGSSSGGLFGRFFGRRSAPTPATPSAPTRITPVRRAPLVRTPVRSSIYGGYGAGTYRNNTRNRRSYSEGHFTGIVAENNPGTLFSLRVGEQTMQVSGARKPPGFSRGDEVAIQGRSRGNVFGKVRFEADTIRIMRNR